MPPSNAGYRVKHGDTLSAIALRHYGDAALWPRIAAANRLPDGNKILVGMMLHLPLIEHVKREHGRPVAPWEAGPAVGPDWVPRPPPTPVPIPYPNVATMEVEEWQWWPATPAAVPVLYPAVKYDLLKDLRPSPIPIPSSVADIEVKLTGEVTIQPKGALVTLELGRSAALAGELKSELDGRLVKLAGSVGVKWDPDHPQDVELSCGFTVATKINGREFVTHGYKIKTPDTFVYTLSPRKIKGESGGMEFEGAMGYEISITPRKRTESKEAKAEAWAYMAAKALVVTGVAIIVVDIAKDVATGGLGAAESPVSFAAAAALFERAAAMLSPAAAMAP